MTNDNASDENGFLGSLWVSVGHDGKQTISGIINGVRVFVHVNKNKKNEKSPTHFVFLAKERDNDEIKF